jgi:hypothetical protein
MMTDVGFLKLRIAAAACAAACILPVALGQTVDFGQEGQPAAAQRGKPGLVALAGAAFLVGPGGSATPLPDPPGFRSEVRVFRESANHFLLVRVEGKQLWGWMQSGDVLQQEGCLRVSEESPIYRKVTLRNDWKAASGDAGGRRLPQTIDFLDAPAASGTSTKSTRISDILYVFARRGEGKDAFLLLGADPVWAVGRPEASIKGWVPETECAEWNSRVAVYYNQADRDQRTKLFIFREEDDVKRWAQDQSYRPKPGEVIAQEPQPTAPLRFDDNRFPVIGQEDCCLKVSFIASGSAIQIGRRLAQNLRNVQILFIIDATKSMQPYFGAVQQAIRESKSGLPANEQAQYHFAAAVYRDYADGKRAAELIANFDDERALNNLGSVVAESNAADHDLPEAVYEGIIQAVGRVKWNPGFTKMVIVIGDHGNHPSAEDAANRDLKDALEPKGRTSQAVAGVLDPKDGALRYGPIMLHAINVNVRQEWLPYNDLFMDQMFAILDATRHGGLDDQGKRGMGSVARLAIDDPRDPERAKDQVKKAIADALASGNRSAEALNTVIDTGVCVPPGSDVDANVFLGTRACDFLMDEVANQKWAPPPPGGYTQISEEGWVLREKDGQELVEPWVWISRNEAFNFIGFLSGLLSASGQPERAAEIIAQTVLTTTGDRFQQGETIADYIKRAYQLPFRDDTILRYTPAELQTILMNDRAAREGYLKEIGRSRERMNFAANEQNPDVPLTWDQTNGRWLTPTADQIPMQKRWAASLGLEQYGWFPLSYLPGGVQ